MYRYAIVLTGRITDATVSQFLNVLKEFGAKAPYRFDTHDAAMLAIKISTAHEVDTKKAVQQLYAIEGTLGAGMTDVTGDKHDIFLDERKCAAK